MKPMIIAAAIALSALALPADAGDRVDRNAHAIKQYVTFLAEDCDERNDYLTWMDKQTARHMLAIGRHLCN